MNTESWQVKVALLLVSSLTIMSMITISASLPDMTKTFSTLPNAENLVKLTLSFPALFIALTAIIAGKFIDKFGRLRLLNAALIIYAIAGSTGYWLENIYLILAGRALLGICVGITMTIATTLIADYYQGKSRQKFAGLQIAVMSLGGILFVTLGGVLADISWRVPFLLYLFPLVILPMTSLYLKEPKTLHVVKNKDASVKSPNVIWLVFINVMIMWILFFIIPVQIPFYLKSIGIEKNTLIGIAIASTTFFSVISSLSFSKIKDKLSFQQVFGIGYLLMALAFASISYGGSYAMVMIGMLLSGLGMGLMIPNANVWVMQLAPEQIRGQEIGRLTTFWFMGQFLSPILLLPFLNIISHTQLFLILTYIILGLSISFFIYSILNKKATYGK